MRASDLSFARRQGFPRTHEALNRRYEFLLQFFTPRTVFMEIGSPDGELSQRAATYVERVWCVDAAGPIGRAPCNLRRGGMGGVPLHSVDVAFSESLKELDSVHQVLAPGGVYFIRGQLLPALMLREAGFARVQYYAGNRRVPGALARISRYTTTAAYK